MSKEHLKRITPDNLTKWAKTAFVTCASSAGRNGFIELGKIGINYCVRHNKELIPRSVCSHPHTAIEVYKELYTSNN